MKLLERICNWFKSFFRKGSHPKPIDHGTGTGGNDQGTDITSGPITPPPSELPNGEDSKEVSQSVVRKPYTVKIVSFLISKLDLDYETTYKVPYSISDSVGTKFPIIRAPEKECEIKLPVIGRNGKRGACEESLCQKIKELKLHGFYDDLSLFIGKNSIPYEPDIAYIDAQKGIFIDIEVDEPYSGRERRPIHYKTKSGTIDDLRNRYFTERGWTVIRFSEKQVHEHPMACLKRVYQLLHEMDAEITMSQCLATETDISPEDMWTEEQAKRKEQNKEREKMLGIDEFIPPVEGSRSNIKDYSHGQEIEENILKRKEEKRKALRCESPFRIPTYTLPQQLTVTTVPNHDDQRRKEAEQYEHPQRPQQVTTQSKPQSTPSSRGYA